MTIEDIKEPDSNEINWITTNCRIGLKGTVDFRLHKVYENGLKSVENKCYH
jgi:hypothetical protein